MKTIGSSRIEAAVREVMKSAGIAVTTGYLTQMVGRDPMSVYRCLLRMKKRGQVVSEPIPGERFRHRWRLA